jgi:tripartite-type tricarboxylate transporter receptor subunit TctC
MLAAAQAKKPVQELRHPTTAWEEAMTSLRLWHAASAVLLATSQAAFAQAWPERTVQAIVPFAAGAANDIVGRIVLEQVSKQVNQPIVVENRPTPMGVDEFGKYFRADVLSTAKLMQQVGVKPGD